MSAQPDATGAQEHWVCPNCSHVGPAHTFKLVGMFVPGWRDASRRRRCPACQSAQLSASFQRVPGGGERVPAGRLTRLAVRWFH